MTWIICALIAFALGIATVAGVVYVKSRWKVAVDVDAFREDRPRMRDQIARSLVRAARKRRRERRTSGARKPKSEDRKKA